MKPIFSLCFLLLFYACERPSPGPLGMSFDREKASFQACADRCLESLSSTASSTPLKMAGDATEAPVHFDSLLKRHFKANPVTAKEFYRHYELTNWWGAASDLELWFKEKDQIHFRIQARGWGSPDPLKTIEQVRFHYYQKNF